MTVYNTVLWLILVYRSCSFAPLMNLYVLKLFAVEMRGNTVSKKNHARLTRHTASWSVMVDVYNYCSAESAKVTVEPVQDKLDKLPPTHPSQHFIRGPRNNHTTVSHSLSQNSLPVYSPNITSFMYSFSADNPLSYWSVVLSGQCNVNWSISRRHWRYINLCLKEIHLKAETEKNESVIEVWIWNTCDTMLPPCSSLTLHPIASSECRTTMVATVTTAINLVSSRTTGQKVRTRTEPEIAMATTISVQCNHSNGMVHRTWRWQGETLGKCLV